ncbi:MAG TPA: hypothetical protein VGC46_00385 [Allosphingosinicella sp.]|jgi:hypothetical protein
MRGTIIHWDFAERSGIISDVSGQRRTFQRGDWRSLEEPLVGRDVDFEIADERPTDIFILPPSGPAMSAAPSGQSEPARQATNYAIISLVCGGIGFMFWPLGLIAAIPAIIFGIKGKRLGQDLADRSPYIMSVGGIVLGAVVGVLGLVFVGFIAAIVSTVIWSGPR